MKQINSHHENEDERKVNSAQTQIKVERLVSYDSGESPDPNKKYSAGKVQAFKDDNNGVPLKTMMFSPERMIKKLAPPLSASMNLSQQAPLEDV